MDNEKMIALENILEHYKVELSFIRSLEDFGLVRIITVGDKPCIDRECLGDVERMMRLHYDLEINMAGIDAICNMLQKMNEMQAEIRILRNRIGDL